jgi:glycosyltransferase involved in cell wall biosynthesis
MGMNQKRIQVLEVGVNPIFTQGSKNRQKLVVSVGRLMRYKCTDHIIYAMVTLRQRKLDVRCEIAGTGPDTDRLRKLIDQLGLEDCVKLLGWVSLEDVARLYQRAAVAVQPSAKEGWGFLATDAGACGTPVVAARVPGLMDSVIDKKTGFLYEHENIEEMSRYLEKLLTDEGLRQKMGQANREWAQTLTWEKVARKVEKLLTRAVEQGVS